jgi:ribosome biogenesis protein NSA1
MTAVVGTDTGLLKVLSLPQQKAASVGVFAQWGSQGTENEVDALCWVNQQDYSEVAVASRSGKIKRMNIISGAESSIWETLTQTTRFASLEFSLRHEQLISCTVAGMLAIGQLAQGTPNAISLKSPVGTLRLEPRSQAQVAYGGKENDVRLFDLEAKQHSWTAKNLANDFLDMRQPVWVNDLQFVCEAPHQIALVTAYHQVRLYDTKAQRRPVINQLVGELPLTALVLKSSSNLIFGDTQGNITEFDLRNCKVVGTYKGLGGGMGVGGLALHPSQPVLASGSLDRFFRLHSTRAPRSLLHKVYMKQRVKAVLLSDHPLPQPYLPPLLLSFLPVLAWAKGWQFWCRCGHRTEPGGESARPSESQSLPATSTASSTSSASSSASSSVSSLQPRLTESSPEKASTTKRRKRPRKKAVSSASNTQTTNNNGKRRKEDVS